MLASKEAYNLVKMFLDFTFSLNDQWVYSQVRKYGQHALYHADTPYKMEKVFHLVGYTKFAVDVDQCGFCRYSDQCYQSPLMNAIMLGRPEHLQNIADIGLSSRDVDPWNDFKHTWGGGEYDMILTIIRVFKTLLNIDDISVLEYFLDCVGCTPGKIELMKLAGIDINTVDEKGNNFMFYSVWVSCLGSAQIKYLYDAGFDFARKNNQGDDILGSIERSLNDYQQIEQNMDLLDPVYYFLNGLCDLPTFENKEGLHVLVQRIAGAMVELEGG